MHVWKLANEYMPADLRRAWTIVACLLAAHAMLLALCGPLFDFERSLAVIPTVSFAAGMLSAGLVYLSMPALIERSCAAPPEDQRRLLLVMASVGLALRLLMFWTVPALEGDYYRYLWDGALGVAGYNPYFYVPGDLAGSHVPQGVRDLAQDAGYVHARINHAELRTIYPPVAQMFFALAHLAERWSLTAWRLVCLLGELASLGLLLALLAACGRNALWAALYWWNPLIIKELMNSAHMEAILMPLVLAALLLAMARRFRFAAAVLGLACGAKIWPLLLAPLVVRPLLADPRRLIAALAILTAVASTMALPPVLSGLDADQASSPMPPHGEPIALCSRCSKGCAGSPSACSARMPQPAWRRGASPHLLPALRRYGWQQHLWPDRRILAGVWPGLPPSSCCSARPNIPGTWPG